MEYPPSPQIKKANQTVRFFYLKQQDVNYGERLKVKRERLKIKD
jgi:hypothetical protein